MKILIMGLPGSGKTALARELTKLLIHYGYATIWLNADEVRKQYNDWDFSPEGRIRQCKRMANLADNVLPVPDHVICDFVAPTNEIRLLFRADFTVWMDTIEAGRFEDTNKVFEKPEKYNVRVTELSALTWARNIVLEINKQKLSKDLS